MDLSLLTRIVFIGATFVIASNATAEITCHSIFSKPGTTAPAAPASGHINLQPIPVELLAGVKAGGSVHSASGSQVKVFDLLEFDSLQGRTSALFRQLTKKENGEFDQQSMTIGLNSSRRNSSGDLVLVGHVTSTMGDQSRLGSYTEIVLGSRGTDLLFFDKYSDVLPNLYTRMISLGRAKSGEINTPLATHFANANSKHSGRTEIPQSWTKSERTQTEPRIELEENNVILNPLEAIAQSLVKGEIPGFIENMKNSNCINCRSDYLEMDAIMTEFEYNQSWQTIMKKRVYEISNGSVVLATRTPGTTIDARWGSSAHFVLTNQKTGQMRNVVMGNGFIHQSLFVEFVQ